METCYKVANPTKVLPKFPEVQGESVTGGFDSRHFLCVGPAPRAVRVCAGVLGGRLAAL